MNTTRHTTVRRVAPMAVLAGAAVLVAAPTFAGAPPGGAVSAISQIKTPAGNVGATSGLSAQTQGEARTDGAGAARPAAPSDPSSVPGTVLALIGGTLVAGADRFIVYRFRHQRPVGAATA